MARTKRVSPSKAEMSVIKNGKLIEEVFATRGWKTLIEPVLDEMIISVIGTKRNGRWLQGHFIKSRKDEKKDFYIGYACALQEFANSLSNYKSSAEAIKKKIAEQNEKNENIVIPMVNDETEENPETIW